MSGMQTGMQKGTLAAVAERRQSTRLTVAIPMFVRGTDQHGNPFVDFATALNISAGGALLVLKRRLQPDAQVSLEIPVGFLPQTLVTKLVQQIQARTLRSEPAEKSFVVGVRFDNPLPA
jgi:hypothetical protein